MFCNQTVRKQVTDCVGYFSSTSHLAEGTSIEELFLSDWSVGMSVSVFSCLTTDVGGTSPLWVEPPCRWSWVV